MKLNQRALNRVEIMLEQSALLRVSASRTGLQTRVVDCGVQCVGSLAAGLQMAEVCLAGLGAVTVTAGPDHIWPGPWIAVTTDAPVLACMAAQYAGWPISGPQFFAMGSGPMRAARGQEPLLDDIGYREHSPVAVGVLETRQLPDAEMGRAIAHQCHVDPGNLTLLVAPTASLAGSIQVVARSVETALHKLHELKFDLRQVVSSWGIAPLPPVAGNDLAAIGRTNDAVLYGAHVTLWVRSQDDELAGLGPRIPSSASPDYGQPFAEIFTRYDRDFYRIDPLLFSPARIQLLNLASGSVWQFGEQNRDVLRRSFREIP